MYKKIFAEIIGTFALLFAGMLAIANDAGLLGIAMAHGMAITIMIMALGAVSGGQFNPAVSIGLSIGGYQDWKTTFMYIPAQLAGAVLGGFAALGVAGPEVLEKVAFSGTAVAATSDITGALLAEIITTMFLVLVIVRTAIHQNNNLAGLFIGLTITISILATGPESGASLNPARAFGSAVVGAGFTNHWLWWVGPIIGGILGVLMANFMKEERILK